MQQRNPASGRPTGTDGYDFSYRMVVDSRYTKVANLKSRLGALFFTLSTIHLVGLVCVALSTLTENDPDTLAISSVALGVISLIIGEIGRRRSRVNFLRACMVASSVAVVISIFCVVMRKFALQVFETPLDMKIVNNIEFLDSARVLIGFVVQIIMVATTISLISNMSPPKRSA